MHKVEKVTDLKHYSKLKINCKEATHLVVLDEFGCISMIQRIRLWFHLRICKACAIFKKQSKQLNALLKINASKKNVGLSLEKKEAIEKLLSEEFK